MEHPDYPGGVRCSECHRDILPSESVQERLTGMVLDIPVVEPVCYNCVLSTLTEESNVD